MFALLLCDIKEFTIQTETHQACYDSIYYDILKASETEKVPGTNNYIWRRNKHFTNYTVMAEVKMCWRNYTLIFFLTPPDSRFIFCNPLILRKNRHTSMAIWVLLVVVMVILHQGLLDGEHWCCISNSDLVFCCVSYTQTPQ